MGGGCKIIGVDYIAQSAKECQEGEANSRCKKGMVEQRHRHDGGETVALDQGYGNEILMSKKVVVHIW
jgi:hypothetical protein